MLIPGSIVVQAGVAEGDVKEIVAVTTSTIGEAGTSVGCDWQALSSSPDRKMGIKIYTIPKNSRSGFLLYKSRFRIPAPQEINLARLINYIYGIRLFH